MTMDDLQLLEDALKVAWLAFNEWDGETDSDDMPCDFHNFYKCEECDAGVQWDEFWSCACDGECGSCGADISPYRSDTFNYVTGEWDLDDENHGHPW